MRWGGKRPGAGRKPVRMQRKLEIGAFCEALHHEEQERQRRARLEERPKVKAIREHQKAARQKLARVRSRFVHAPQSVIVREIAKDSAQIADLGRLHSAPTRRPKGLREKIKNEAAKRFGVSPGAVDEYWRLTRKLADEHRRTPHSRKRALRNYHST